MAYPEAVRGKLLSKFVSVLMSISILFSQFPVQAQLAFDYTQLTNIDVDSAVEGKPLSSAEETEIKDILKLPTQHTLEILALLKGLYNTMVNEERELGEEAIIKILRKRKDSENIFYEVNGIGKAEPMVIDVGMGRKPIIITRVRHDGLKMSLLFIDKNQIDLAALEAFELADRTGLLALYEPFKGLPPEQINTEIVYQRLLIKKIRKIWAGVLMAKWNPSLEYSPLVKLDDKKIDPQVDKNIRNDVATVLQAPFSEVRKKSWFKSKLDKAYTLWVDYAAQEKIGSEKQDGNRALLTVLFDGNSGQPPVVNKIQRPKATTLEYWKKYWRAIWEPPNYSQETWSNSTGWGKIRILATGDYLMGLGFGLALGGLSFLMSSFFPDSLPLGLTPAMVGSISLGWSIFFGVFTQTWQNFTYRGNDFIRFLKNWSTGIGQSYHFNLVSEESLSVLSQNDQIDLNAIKAHSDILINQSIKSSSKTSLQEKYRFRARKGESDGNLKIPYFKVTAPWKANNFMEFESVENTFDLLKYAKKAVELFSIDPLGEANWEKYFRFTIPDLKIKVPWVHTKETNPQTGEETQLAWDTKIPKRSFEGQKPQLLTTPIGLLSRFGYTIWGIPLGHILYALLGPFGEIQQVRYKTAYAEKINEVYGETHPFARRIQQEAQLARAKWNSLKEYKIRKISTLFTDGKEYYEFKIPYSQFIGYYFKVIPQSLEAAKDVLRWLTLKTSAITYTTYEQMKARKAAATTATSAIGRTQSEKDRLCVQIFSFANSN